MADILDCVIDLESSSALLVLHLVLKINGACFWLCIKTCPPLPTCTHAQSHTYNTPNTVHMCTHTTLLRLFSARLWPLLFIYPVYCVAFYHPEMHEKLNKPCVQFSLNYFSHMKYIVLLPTSYLPLPTLNPLWYPPSCF